jgi:ankyrin repeat protein
VSENPASVNAVDAVRHGFSYPAFILWQVLPLQDSRTPLQWAASAGHLDIVTYLLANGAEVDKVDDSGWTALHIAGALTQCIYCAGLPLSVLFLVSAGQEEVVRELVGAGAEVNRKNDKGITSLFVSRALLCRRPF